MIKFSSQLKAALTGKGAGGRIQIFYLIRIGNWYSTTWYNDITVDGQPYTANSLVTGIQPPETDSSLDKNRFKISFADQDNILNSELESLIGAPAHVYLGATNDKGAPMTAKGDLFLMYKGTIDGASVSYETSTLGKQTITLELTNPFHNLDRKKTFYTTRKELRSRSPNDTSFDQIYTGSNHIMLRWGKYFGS